MLVSFILSVTLTRRPAWEDWPVPGDQSGTGLTTPMPVAFHLVVHWALTSSLKGFMRANGAIFIFNELPSTSTVAPSPKVGCCICVNFESSDDPHFPHTSVDET